jgi:integrase
MSKELRGSGRVYRVRYANKQLGPIWWMAWSVRGKLYRESSKSTERSVAVKLLKHRVAESAGGKPVIGPTAERVTLATMLDALKDDYARKGNRSAFVPRAASLLAGLGEDTRAVNITRDVISRYIAERRKQLIRRATGKEIIVKGKLVAERILRPPSNGTLNYELRLLRRAFHIQVEARKLSRDHVPVMPMLEKSRPRQGFLDPAEFEQLHAALPEYLRDVIRFLYLSGWRKNEALTLEHRDVELDRDKRGAIIGGMIHLRAEQSKTKETRTLPLSDDLLAIMGRADAARSLACPFVFALDGKKLPSFRKTWRTVCKAAGLSALLIHDLRRSSIRNLVRAGVPESVAMGFSGHRTRAIFDNYDVLDKKDLEAAMTKVSAYVRERAQERPAAQNGLGNYARVYARTISNRRVLTAYTRWLVVRNPAKSLT